MSQASAAQAMEHEMLQIMANVLRTAAYQDAFEAISSAASRRDQAERERAQADALMQIAKARRENAEAAEAAAAARAARSRPSLVSPCAARPFGRRMRRLSLGFSSAGKAA